MVLKVSSHLNHSDCAIPCKCQRQRCADSPGRPAALQDTRPRSGLGASAGFQRWSAGEDHLAPLLFAQPSKLDAWGSHGPRVPQPSVQGSLCACCRLFQQQRGSAGADLGCKPRARSRAELLAVCGARAQRSRLPEAHMWLCRCPRSPPSWHRHFTQHSPRWIWCWPR